MVGGNNRPARRITDRPKGSCVMKILRYLPLLALVWVTTAAGEDDPQAVSQMEVRREIEGILARP